jgi:hypothetical protein
MSKRETILQALVALLAGIPGCTGVYRSREDAMSRDESPAIVVRPENERPAENALGLIDATLTVAVEVYARGDAPDSVADPVVEQAFARIMGSPTLGGLAVDTTEGPTDFDADGADVTAGITTMRFEVWHRRPRTALS